MQASPERPTVCHVLHSLEVGGAEILARRFALGMQERFRPVFACLDGLGSLGESLRAAGHPIRVVERRPGFDLRCTLRLRRWFQKQKVQLVHAHQYAPFFYSALARTGLGLPVLFTEHGRDYPDYRRPKRVLANRWLLRPRDRVVAVGQQVREALIQHEGLPEDRVSVIYNGVDARAYDAHRPLREAVRGELGYLPEHWVILQVARLNRLKDHATAIRAIDVLRRALPTVRLVFVGDGEERPALEAQVASLGLQETVRFLGSRNDVPRLLQAADAFLLSSISEGIPLTLVEAMLAGVPVVSTRVGGVPEVIDHETTGLLASPADAAGLATALSRVLVNADFSSTLRIAAHAKACGQFSESRMFQAYEHVYCEQLEFAPSKLADMPSLMSARCH